jgi:hypothetical protein
MAVTLRDEVAGQTSTDHVVNTSAAVMSTALTIFNVVGNVQIISLMSECSTTNGASASTLAYSAVSPSGTTALTSASTSLANVAVGYSVIMANASAVGEAPLQGLSGVLLNSASRGVRIPSGTAIKTTIATGPTTGTWKHYIRWEPLEQGAYITAAF